ncbi:MAG: hypothetical protein ABI315_08220 [Bacteroidia bacterium]
MTTVIINLFRIKQYPTYFIFFKNKLSWILVSSLLFSRFLIACECPPILPISTELAKPYTIIFNGRVDSVSICNTDGLATAYFTINKLFKGAVQQNVKIYFDCSSPCMMSLNKNDEWLIYAKYMRFNQLTILLCSHSRKSIEDLKQDYYAVSAGRSFTEEVNFLQQTMGLQPFIKEENMDEVLQHHNLQPSGQNKIYLLLISISVMIIIYFISRKKNGK